MSYDDDDDDGEGFDDEDDVIDNADDDDFQPAIVSKFDPTTRAEKLPTERESFKPPTASSSS